MSLHPSGKKTIQVYSVVMYLVCENQFVFKFYCVPLDFGRSTRNFYSVTAVMN